MKFFLLENKRVVECKTMQEWLERHAALPPENDLVAETQIGETRISTAFLLGINHNYQGKGEPILFETMTFGGMCDEWQRRYHTYEEAQQGHAEIVAEVQEAQHELDKMYAKIV